MLTLGQALKIFKRTTNLDTTPTTGIAINKSSIGYIWINGIKYGYNIDLLSTNTIDFEKELEPSNKKVIFIRKR